MHRISKSLSLQCLEDMFCEEQAHFFFLQWELVVYYRIPASAKQSRGKGEALLPDGVV